MEQERAQMDPKDQWDLSSLYADDKAWEEDLARMDEDTEKAASFAGKLKDAESIAAFYEAQTALERRMNNLLTYAMLRESEDTRAPKAKELMAKGMSRAVEAESRCAFAEPEILSLPKETLESIAESEPLRPYRFLFQELLDEKPHVLSREEEELLSGLSEVLEAPKTIADSLMDADLTFAPVPDGEGKETELTQANFILLEQSEDRTLRENAFHSFYHGYASHGNTLAAAYSGIVKSYAARAKARHYESSRDMALSGEHIPAAVYDGLVESVRRHLPSMYRYVALRKKLLGLSELHYYDVYVPLTQGLGNKTPDPNAKIPVSGSQESEALDSASPVFRTNKSGICESWSYEDAKKLVLEALSPLGKEYTDQVAKALEDRWIDVYPNAGKRGGAFSSGTYDSNPFILMSYTGDYESVTTIAHEMGHSMHTWYAKNHQPSYYADYTLFVAEVASTVNENLLVEDLLSKTTDPAFRLFLLNQYLEGFKATVYRQTMFAEFEKKAHEMAERGEALTVQSLNALYRGLIADYFGPELVIDDEVACEWSRIPHFYRPFYVYKYATSYAAAVALSEKILKEGEKAVTPYLEFLSMGGSTYPLDELRHAGVDMATAAPIDAALDKFDRILDEAEKCAEELNLH